MTPFSPSTKERLAIVLRARASNVLLACRPDHCGACLQVMQSAAVAASALSGTITSAANEVEIESVARE